MYACMTLQAAAVSTFEGATKPTASMLCPRPHHRATRMTCNRAKKQEAERSTSLKAKRSKAKKQESPEGLVLMPITHGSHLEPTRPTSRSEHGRPSTQTSQHSRRHWQKQKQDSPAREGTDTAKSSRSAALPQPVLSRAVSKLGLSLSLSLSAEAGNTNPRNCNFTSDGKQFRRSTSNAEAAVDMRVKRGP